MQFDSPQAQRDLDHKLWWMFLGRMVVVIISLGVMLLYNLGAMPGGTFPYPAAVLIAAALLDIVYVVVTPAVRNKRMLAAVEITLDVMITAMLVYLTGGVSSVFGIIFFACVVAASITLSLSASLFFASLATLLLSTIALTYVICSYNGVQPWLVDSAWYSIILEDAPITRLANLEAAKLLAFSGSLFLVAVLSGQLAQRLRGEIILKEEILENVGDGIIVLDRFARAVYVSRRAREILGDDEPDRRPHEANADRCLKRVAEMIASGRTEFETAVRDSRRGGVPIHVTANTLYSMRGQLRGVIITVRDLSERKKMEAAELKAEQLDLMRRMSASIAHEIRNPIASSRGAAAELETDHTTSEPNRQMLRVIVEESDRTEKIVTNYLKYARLPNAELRSGDLAGVLKDAVASLRAGHLRPGQRIDLAESGPLPVRFDVDQIKQVFVNLGMNALEQMPEDASLRVRARIEKPPPSVGNARMVAVRFIDEGEGIDEAVRERMFQPFVTTKAAGSGMGLTIVEAIVHTHGGSVTAENNPDRGATFTVWLPLAVPGPPPVG